jgi:bifunctional non-homologous end joining protein LigD
VAHCGRVGTGFTQAAIPDLLRRLQGARRISGVSLENPPTRAQLRGATPVWVRPQLVVEVQFRGLTEEGLLRQASLKGLRPDRSVGSLSGAAHDAVKLRMPAQAGAKQGRARRRRGGALARRPGAA